MSEDIFSSTPAEPESPASESDQAPQEEGLAFIGEGRKYASVEEADKGLLHANDHIKRLEEENAKLRDVANEAKTVDAILERMRDVRQDIQADDHEEVSEDNRQAQVDPERLEQTLRSMVESTLTAREAEAAQAANARQVVKALRDVYGDKAEEVFAKRQGELGVDLNTIAKTSPQAAMELLNVKQATPRTPMQSSVNASVATAGDSSGKYGTYAYWKKQYNEGKISIDKMLRGQHESLSAMGPDAFYK